MMSRRVSIVTNITPINTAVLSLAPERAGVGSRNLSLGDLLREGPEKRRSFLSRCREFASSAPPGVVS